MASNNVGMFGSELRQAVSDPNADKAATPVAPGQVPVGGVITPMNSDFSKVGQDDSTAVISNLLGSASSIVGDYLDRKKDQYNLDGQMAYAQGKTQNEIASSGNQYTMAGFMSMKARVASNDWYQNSLNDINNQDKTLDPAAYTKKLSDSYSAMQDSIAGSDPFTKNLMTTLASENFPKLAAQQVQSNNAWKQQQTMTSYTDMLVSEATKADPASPESPADKQARIHQLTSPSYSGLPDTLHKEAVTQAVQLSLKLGNDSLFKSLGTSEQERISAMNLGGNTPELTAAVMSVESNGNPLAIGPKTKSGEHAEGSMQTMPATLSDPGYGVKPAQNNSPEEKARVGRDYLQAMLDKYKGNQTLALAAYNAGPATVDSQIAKLGDPGVDNQATAAFIKAFPYAETRDYVQKVQDHMNATPGAATQIPVPVTPVGGKAGTPLTVEQAKNMGGDTFNAAKNNAQGNTPGMIPASSTLLNVANSNLTIKTSAFSALLNAGYTPAQVETISSSYTAYQDKKTQNYNTQRIMDEQSVKVAAQQTGNLPAALNSITDLKEKNGYSDAWANSLAETAAGEVQAGLLKRQAQVRLTNALSTNGLQNLGKDEIPEALTIARAQVSGAVQGATPPSDVPPDQVNKWKQDQFREKYSDLLIKNGVTDPTWGATMNSAFEGSLTNKDGTIRPAVLSAYDDYQYLSKAASPAYAASFLSEPAKAIVAQVDSFAAGGINASQGLRTVSDIQTAKSTGAWKAPNVSPEDIANAAGITIAKITPAWFSYLDRGNEYATTWMGLRPGQVDALKTSPVLSSAIQAQTMVNLGAHPEMTPEAAAGQAAQDISSRADYVGDNVLIAGKMNSVREEMGIKSTAQGSVNAAVTGYMIQKGHNLLGAQWDSQVPDGTVFKDGFQGPLEYVGSHAAAIQLRKYDQYGEPEYWIGNKQIGGFPALSASAASESVYNLVQQHPKFNVKYNSNDGTMTVDLYTNREGTRLAHNPVVLNAKQVGAWYNATMAPTTK